jgi:hypothetical protein
VRAKPVRSAEDGEEVVDMSYGDDVEYDLSDELPSQEFDRMPTEEELEAARRGQPPVPLAESDSDVEAEEEQGDDEANSLPKTEGSQWAYEAGTRQTLLFSATMMGVGILEEEDRGGKKKRRLQHKAEKSLGGEKKMAALRALGIPDHLRQLLEAVGIQDTTLVAKGERGAKAVAGAGEEGTGVGKDPKTGRVEKRKKTSEVDIDDEVDGEGEGDGGEQMVSLPKGLTQHQVCMPVEDKDVVAYYFLLKVQARAQLPSFA